MLELASMSCSSWLEAVRRCAFTSILIGFAGTAITMSFAQTDASAWSRVPDILSRIVPPTFPDSDFRITDYGAVGDGVTDCTAAFQNAIAACNGAGGGRVVVPTGTYFTGAIHLLSDVNLYISANAVIRFSTNSNAYLPVVFTRHECTEVMSYSPFIYAFQQTNVAITGEGIIDGQGPSGPWPQWVSSGLESQDTAALVDMGNNDVSVDQRIFGAGHYLRPNFIQPFRCRNVLIEGVTFSNSPMWVLNPVYCTNVTIQRVKVNINTSLFSANSDGCDPDSSTDVLIRDCTFNDGDDCIAIKSGRDRDGRRVNIPSQNIVVQNCKFQAGHGGVTAGSETAAGITNVFVENCAFDSASLQYAMRFKTCAQRGGYISDFYIRNCIVKTAQVGIHATMLYCAGGTNIPVVHNIDIRDCAFLGLTSRPVLLQGYSSSNRITDVNIINCRFGTAPFGNSFSNTNRINRINSRGGGV